MIAAYTEDVMPDQASVKRGVAHYAHLLRRGQSALVRITPSETTHFREEFLMSEEYKASQEDVHFDNGRADQLMRQLREASEYLHTTDSIP